MHHKKKPLYPPSAISLYNIIAYPFLRKFFPILLKFQKYCVSLSPQCPIYCSCRGAAILSGGHYIMKKLHTMLCRLTIRNYHRRLQVKDNAEFDVTGMLRKYPVVCVKVNHTFNAHLRVYQQYFTWVSLCSSTCRAVVSLRWWMSRR